MLACGGTCKEVPLVSMSNSLAASDQRATSISANFILRVEYLRSVHSNWVSREAHAMSTSYTGLAYFNDKSAKTGSKLSQ